MSRSVVLKAGDRRWLALGGIALVCEFTGDELLSEATERYIKTHPWVTRLVILAIAGHLGCVLPSCVDVFSAKNLIHRGVVFGCRQTRKCL